MKNKNEKARRSARKIDRQIAERSHAVREEQPTRESVDALEADIKRLRAEGEGMRAWALQNHWARLKDEVEWREQAPRSGS